MADVSVLVATRNPGHGLADLVRSIDAQSLPATAFELVVVDASDDGSADRLLQLAARRPNVTVLPADAALPEAERLGLALERATGDAVLAVGQDLRLAPLALELLRDRLRETGADVVVGRVVGPHGSGSAAVPDDEDAVDVARLDGCLGMIRRTASTAAADLLRPWGTPDAGRAIASLGRYALARHGAPVAAPEDAGVARADCRWHDGTLEVSLEVPVPQGGRAWLVASRDLEDIAVPAGTVDGSTVRAVLDPASAAAGRPLADGLWDLAVRLVADGSEVLLPLPPGPDRSAVVDGRPHVLRTDGGVLRLDAGATRSGVIGAAPRSRTALAESSRGILLTIDYPDVHAHGDADLPARLVLDGFRLPAVLVCRDGAARLECFASSLAGTPALAVLAGGGKPVPTGLRLRVAGDGAMAIEPVPAPRPAPPRPAPGPARMAQRLRRRVPRVLDPVLRGLVRVPAVRRAYRSLISR